MGHHTQIVFFIPPGVHMLDLSGPIQTFFEAARLGGNYKLLYCAFQPDIDDASGLHFARLEHYSQLSLQAGDYLFIPGFDKRLLPDKRHQQQWDDFYAWLRQQHELGVNLCSVCIGSFVLGRAGLLNGRKCTTHWSMLKEFRKELRNTEVLDDQLFVKDDNIYTSAGISAGIDLALFILEENHDALFVHKIARELVVYFRRSGQHTQESVYLNYRNHLHQGIHQLQDWLIEHLATKSTIEEMAQVVNMSSRNLTRTFKQQTGISVHEYITLLRVERARTLQHTPGITMDAIAAQCGFENVRQLQRIRKAHLF
ncbi:AraC family transcriptional regulator [Chitinophaga agrisoli]|uniref:AraC family transcriptional regulator n=2 Tax=Chitinophaga agrisoli TaxID=2607653 RepID=A0A5B2VP55_9BACT|nr:AraC family transcriptional regulator [Chitinophaga agrisoli]